MTQMYFIALVAPQQINGQILRWKELMKERFGCLVALRSPAHITLIPPFWMDIAVEDELTRAISEFAEQGFSFEVQLRNFGAFKPRVIYVDVVKNELLSAVQLRLEQHLRSKQRFAIKEEIRPFHPHVTIATRDLGKQSFLEAWGQFNSKKFEATWKCSGVSLLRHNQKNWDVIFTSQFK